MAAISHIQNKARGSLVPRALPIHRHDLSVLAIGKGDDSLENTMFQVQWRTTVELPSPTVLWGLQVRAGLDRGIGLVLR